MGATRISAVNRSAAAALVALLACGGCLKKGTGSGAKSILDSRGGQAMVDEVFALDDAPAGNGAGAPMALQGPANAATGDAEAGVALTIAKNHTGLCFPKLALIPGQDPDTETGRPAYREAIASGGAKSVNRYPVRLGDLEKALSEVPSIAPKIAGSRKGLSEGSSKIAEEMALRYTANKKEATYLGAAAVSAIVGFNLTKAWQLGTRVAEEAEKLEASGNWWQRMKKHADLLEEINSGHFDNPGAVNPRSQYAGFFRRVMRQAKKVCWNTVRGAGGAALKVAQVGGCVTAVVAGGFAVDHLAKKQGLVKDTPEFGVKSVDEILADPSMATVIETQVKPHLASLRLELDGNEFSQAEAIIARLGETPVGAECADRLKGPESSFQGDAGASGGLGNGTVNGVAPAFGAVPATGAGSGNTPANATGVAPANAPSNSLGNGGAR